MIEKNLKKDNLTISLNVLYTKSEKIRFQNKTPSQRKHSFNDFKRRTIALYYSKEIFSIITSKHPGSFYCLNCLHSFATENKCE